MRSNIARFCAVVVSSVVLCCLSLDDGYPALFKQSFAVIGAPLTPVSYRGVARRTTRRTVAVTSTATSSAAASNNAAAAASATAAAEAEQAAAQAQTAASQAQVAATQAAADSPPQSNSEAQSADLTASLPVGSTLPSLPSGCDTQTVNEQSYFVCEGDWFRPAMQGSEIVYAVVEKPA